MATDFAAPALKTVAHYLDRCQHLLQLVRRENTAADLLVTQIAPDGFNTGTHLAIAIQFAARTAGPPAGVQVPEIPDAISVRSLTRYHDETAMLVARITPDQLRYVVSHTAGKASLTQEPEDYILRFALPTMIFHLSMAYAALRVAGLDLGKADFDALHEYGGTI